MSYKAYLNGQEIDISDTKPIAYNKQVNDLARLDNRQTNFTHKFILPFSAKNIKVVREVFLNGSTSNIPYEKCTFDLIDADTGLHLIYKGWAVLGATTTKGYELNTYDGIIDFYRTIENKVLTDAGISELNHIKNVANIINTWTNDLPYKYIIADYGGKVFTTDSKINADYLVPSVKISYLWDKVHQFAGYTYEGSIFATPNFINHWKTFPKPVPTDEPSLTSITTQDWAMYADTTPFPYRIDVFPEDFTTAYANNIGAMAGVVNITQDGSYMFNSSGELFFYGIGEITELNYRSYDSIGNLIEGGTFNPSISQDVIVQCLAGGKLIIGANFIGDFTTGWAVPITGTLTTKLYLIDGYNANYEQALIDFQMKDFLNEIMQHYGITAFKDKYKNHIVYKNLEEILQNNETLDWSDKFSEKVSEKYILSNYAKKNAYKYRYNRANEIHNDGYLYIENENLKDETTVLNSKIYSPESFTSIIAGETVNVYPLWEKTIKDNNEVDYKDLTGRYYYLRSENKTVSSYLKSEILNTSQTFTEAPFENYYRLKLQQVIYDNYSTIQSLFYQAKTLEANFYLSTNDVESFDFQRLIFIKQLGSYYLVNKIINFIKGQKVKLELIEVDYFRELPIPEPTEFYITIESVSTDGCEVTFNIDTNIEQPATVDIIAYALTPDGLGGTYYAPLVTIENVNLNSDTIVYEFTELPPQLIGDYKFKIIHTTDTFLTTESNLTDVIDVDTSCYVAPDPDLNYITITDVETLSISGNQRTVRVHYVSDLSLTSMPLTLNILNPLFGFSQAELYLSQPQNGSVDVVLQHSGTPVFGVYVYELSLTSMGVTSNTATSVG